MQVFWVNRAKVALRSLGESDHRRVQSAVQRLADLPPNGLARVPEIKAMLSKDGERLYSYNMGDAMRLVFSIATHGATIEDIAPTSRVERVA